MRKDLVKKIESSFLSCEKDVETILKKLFVENPRGGEDLKRLLILNTKDCLDNRESEVFNKTLQDKGKVFLLIQNGYIRLAPKIAMPEHEEVKSYILISFDNFTPNAANPEFRDCTITFDIICHTDYWDLGNFRQRPIKILGYIDGLLNNARLSGIGTLNFMGANQLILNEHLSGYTLMYRAIHGGDDLIEPEE